MRDQSLTDWPVVHELEQNSEAECIHIAAVISEGGDPGVAAAMNLTLEETSRVDEILSQLASQQDRGQIGAETDNSYRGEESDTLKDGGTTPGAWLHRPLPLEGSLSSITSQPLSVM